MSQLKNSARRSAEHFGKTVEATSGLVSTTAQGVEATAGLVFDDIRRRHKRQEGRLTTAHAEGEEEGRRRKEYLKATTARQGKKRHNAETSLKKAEELNKRRIAKQRSLTANLERKLSLQEKQRQRRTQKKQFNVEQKSKSNEEKARKSAKEADDAILYEKISEEFIRTELKV